MAIIVGPRQETTLETISRVASDMIGDIRAIKEKRFERELTEGVMQRMSMGQTPEQISGYISKQMQPPDTFWGKLLAPRRTPDIAKNMMNMYLRQQMRPQKAPKQYDILTLNDELYRITHSKNPKTKEVVGIEPSQQDMSALRMAAKQSGYEIVGEPVPGRTETKTKKFLGIDRLWPDEDIEIPPSTKYRLVPIGGSKTKRKTIDSTELEPLLTGDDVPDLYKRLGITEYRPSAPTKGKVGDVVSKGGRKWKIVRFDEDGEPLVEEFR